MTDHSSADSSPTGDPIADLRRDYARASLGEADTGADPIALFQRWFDEARSAQVAEPNAMTLATVTPEGRPDARIVLLKGLDDPHHPARGFRFFTNRSSRKGSELATTPFATLVFFWPELERQVRIEGRVAPLTDEESDAYYHSRPRGSQIGAWASNQSQPIPTREDLERHVQEAEAAYANADPIPRPPHWGGYRVTPDAIEFWQGRPSRLHDRIQYRRHSDRAEWDRLRLQP